MINASTGYDQEKEVVLLSGILKLLPYLAVLSEYDGQLKNKTTMLPEETE